MLIYTDYFFTFKLNNKADNQMIITSTIKKAANKEKPLNRNILYINNENTIIIIDKNM